MRAAQGGRPGGASAQRISDWKAGRNVPARFESLLPVVLTLVELARKANHPLTRQLAEAKEWQRLWHAATTWDPDEDTEAACPYLGLGAYRREDRELFFGRARATEELTELVGTATGIVMVVGTSGAGKSSLLSAGLTPALRDWEVTTATPGAHPSTALRTALDDPEELPTALAPRPKSVRRLVIIDQFEELFTTCESEREREEFLTALHTAATRNDDPVAVVLAVRADFYAHCLNHLILQEALEQRSYLLGPMRTDELAQAISGPARKVGLELEPGLEELVITELCGTAEHPDRRSYDPGALPLLSHVMAATWQHREGRRLTVTGYRKAGGVVGSVAETAEYAWNELTSAQQDAARGILLGLVAVGRDSRDTRRPGIRSDLLAATADPEAATTALELLSRTRLITLESDAVNLTHEIVLTAWPRLRSWIDEDRVGYLVRQRLETDAAEWAAHERDSSLLYRGTRLRQAADHANPPPVGPLAHEFLTAAATARRKSRRRSRNTRINSAFLALGMVALAIGLYVQNDLADQRRDDRDFAALLAQADRVHQTDSSLAAQLNLIAWRMRPGDADVRARLLQTQIDPLVTVTPAHPQVLLRLGYQPGGSVLASLASDRGLRLWDTADARHPRPLGNQLDGVDDVALGSGNLMATATSAEGSPRTVTLWDLTIPAAPRSLATLPDLPDSGPLRITFAADGHTLAVVTRAHLMLWNVGASQTPVLAATRPLAASGGLPGNLRLSPDGHLLALTATDDHTTTAAVQLWDVRNPATPALTAPVVGGPAELLLALAFSPDSTMLAVGTSRATEKSDGSNPGVALWDVRDAAHPHQTASIDTGSTLLRALDFSPRGDALAVSGNRGSSIWNVTDPTTPARLIDALPMSPAVCHFGEASSRCMGGPDTLAFAPDGRELAAGGYSGDIQIWSLPTGVLPQHSGLGMVPMYAANGSRLATVGSAGRITLWDVRNPELPTRIGEYRAEADSIVVRLSTDGNTLLVFDAPTGRVRTVDISDPAHPRLQGDWTPPAPESNGVQAVTLDHRLMATARDDSFQLWDLSDPTRPQPVGARYPLSSGSPLFGPRDSTMFLYRLDGKEGARQLVIDLWDITDPAAPQRLSEVLRRPSSVIDTIGLSDDRRTMIDTSNERIQLWDISTPTRPVRLGGPTTAHTVPIAPTGLTSDTRNLFMVGVDGVLQRWDITDRAHPKRTLELTQSIAYSWSASLAPDERHLASSSTDGTLHLWDLDEQHAADRICAITGGLWTEDLWHRYLPQLPYRPPCH
ncbi:NACHT and WD repeat domain-containing protein [Nocardia sp. NPDC059240]|uniref:NACHT and WD repeat domain-containing protein n=1 Tax=Nocardia sp. NPDC059240 TaxID=3346786 RepID=UPI0036871699